MDILISLSKVLPRFVMPLNVALVLLVCVYFLLSRSPKSARALLIVAIGLLSVFSVPRVAGYLIQSLEQYYPPIQVQDAPYADAIVLLGGAVSAPEPPRPDVQLGSGGDRLLTTARLWKAGKAPLILIAGGNVYGGQFSPEADYTSAILIDWGIAESAFVKDRKSRNTSENATEVAALLKTNGLEKILLVTSAMHMPRAMALFRSEGIDVTAVPANHWITYGENKTLSSWIPSAINLSGSTRALREYLGMLYYLVTGRLTLSNIMPSEPAF